MSSGHKRRRLKKTKIALLIVELIAMAAAIVALIIVIKTTNKKSGIRNFELKSEDIVINSEVAKKIEENPELQNYTNLALFGVDVRSKDTQYLTKSSRTDTIIICSINNVSKEIRLASVYRDTYLNLGNDTYNKANSAYLGGPAQSIKMLNENLDLNITGFITVGFQGVIKAVDAVGGVEINVTQAEIEHLNNYQASIYATEENPHKLLDPGEYTPVVSPGMQTLNGQQALAYCRIRYIGNDFQRTERQRAVIQQIMAKAQRMSPTQLNQMVTDVFPLVGTSFKFDELLSLVSNVGQYQIVETTGFPFDGALATGMIGSKGSCVIPIDLKSNVTELHKFLYNEEDYVPSQRVEICNDQIHEDTARYIGR